MSGKPLEKIYLEVFLCVTTTASVAITAGGSSFWFCCSAAVAAATTALPTVAATPLITAAAAIAAKYKKGAPIGAPTDLSKSGVSAKAPSDEGAVAAGD